MHGTYFKIALTLRLGSSCFNSRANNCAAYSGALTEANMKETAKMVIILENSQKYVNKGSDKTLQKMNQKKFSNKKRIKILFLKKEGYI